MLLHWWTRNNYSATFSTKEKLNINKTLLMPIDERFNLNLSNMVYSMENVYMPTATAPLIEPTISSRSFYEDYELMNNNKFQKYIF
jgi:hypothetical protein